MVRMVIFSELRAIHHHAPAALIAPANNLAFLLYRHRAAHRTDNVRRPFNRSRARRRDFGEMPIYPIRGSSRVIQHRQFTALAASTFSTM
jgi:hypothetical protein